MACPGTSDASMRFAVLGFRDVEDARPREKLDFTPSQAKLQSFLDSLRAETQHQATPPSQGRTQSDGWRSPVADYLHAIYGPDCQGRDRRWSTRELL